MMISALNHVTIIKENIICSKYINVIKVQKHKFAYIKFMTKKSISQLSAEMVL